MLLKVFRYLKRNFKSVFLSLFLLFFIVVLAVFPDEYISSSFDGIKLFCLSVLPSLLPFFFLTGLLTKTGTLNVFSNKLTPITRLLFRCNGISAYAFIMSILSGYPVGSRIIYDLKESGLIDGEEGTRMSVFCSTSGPLFVIGAVGTCMFLSKKIGFIIYLSHVLSALINGLIFRSYGKSQTTIRSRLAPKKDLNVLYESVYNAVISVLIVGGFVSVFYVFSDILYDFKILLPLEKFFNQIFDEQTSIAITKGLIECTKGCKMLSLNGGNKISIALASSLISFGGISIIAQSIVYLKRAEVNVKIFIFAKFIQMITSFILTYLLSLFL